MSSSASPFSRATPADAVRILTVANQLTFLRILVIPAFVLLITYGYLGWALLAFIGAGLTDALDGLIARRANQRTSLGAWLDPMADKLLLVTTFIVLTLPAVEVTNHIPLWLTILLISRDVVIVGVVAIVNLAVGPRTFRPSFLGKLATATYLLVSIVFMYFNWRGEKSWAVDAAVYLALAVTLVSSADYFVRMRRLINEGH
jgi:cardiolipin synthase